MVLHLSLSLSKIKGKESGWVEEAGKQVQQEGIELMQSTIEEEQTTQYVSHRYPRVT